MTTRKKTIKAGLRLPEELHQELLEAAKLKGRSLNAEMIARLSAPPGDPILNEVHKQTSALQDMAKEILDAVRNLQ
ncbi:Arc family DNA-binding protein [Pseudoduganella eburnea]|uniref:Arc family DNA-binding protein n=1 Tax=Massilia eburnea TaxID=1776165 RepID=A0A6L6QG00_9BURK|nr:Arc family DNA-binding protein [Massilia eburnea]MTW11408.1 Arc family DNA-binding protein [Massilia eburnea]